MKAENGRFCKFGPVVAQASRLCAPKYRVNSAAGAHRRDACATLRWSGEQQKNFENKLYKNGQVRCLIGYEQESHPRIRAGFGGNAGFAGNDAASHSYQNQKAWNSNSSREFPPQHFFHTGKRRRDKPLAGFKTVTGHNYFSNNAHAHYRIGACPCKSPVARGRSR